MTTSPAQGEHAQPALSYEQVCDLLKTGKPSDEECRLIQLGYSAAQPAPVAQAGWKLVPIEPTDAMLQAAELGDREYSLRNFGEGATVMQGPYDHWVAMIDAAPAKTEHAPAVVSTISLSQGQWFSFKDKKPPLSAAIDDKKVKTADRVLATNNIGARDRMGRMSHVWFAAPIKSGQDWCVFDESDRKIEFLTHWFDPFANVVTQTLRAASHGQAPAGAADRYIDGVNVERLREALVFLGCRAEGQEAMAANLSQHINTVTRAVLSCKELLRPTAQAAPAGVTEVRAVCDQLKSELAGLHERFPETRPTAPAAGAIVGRRLLDEIQRLAQFADTATRMGPRHMHNNMETLAQELNNLLAAAPTPAAQADSQPAPDIFSVLDAFEGKQRGIPQAHIAAALVQELRAAIEARSADSGVQEDEIAMIDAAMVEMANIHPPLKRSECARLIRAALAAKRETP
ncbi:hypothetical protein [Acidovorax sp. Leaf78]|uniref:hypothetical protein n=1 Tax=Acidovorax sp. Leaf78 TaxID=1736237 RepID=UPI0006F3C4D4|nr:hypothetical protein [Acidovorax sp. Leaf78]KQO23464.1 hypothetical protein ASF16_04695 [Acidovorax sp. Leaf78]